MREELARAVKAPQAWVAFAVCFMTLMGYSLAYWIGTNLAGEWLEYRESALQLSIGGISLVVLCSYFHFVLLWRIRQAKLTICVQE